MANENDKKAPQLQIEVKPEIATGTYSNLAVVTHSQSEFVLDFVSMLPGMPKAEVASRVILVPEHAKRLLFALQDNLQKYEAQFGSIDLKMPNAKSDDPNTINPFNIKKGDA